MTIQDLFDIYTRSDTPAKGFRAIFEAGIAEGIKRERDKEAAEADEYLRSLESYEAKPCPSK